MMGAQSKIEWTDATWNPVRGCSVLSPGCHRCYARSLAARFSYPGGWGEGFAEMTEHGPQWTGKMALVPANLTIPLRWRSHKRVFVNSTSDLFHEGLADEDIDRVFTVMAICALHERNYGHLFQILTKRSARMRDYASATPEHMRDRLCRIAGQLMEDGDGWADKIAFEMPWPLPNVHLGVSVEDQKRADERLTDLLTTRAAVRFVSYEPALGPVDFRPWLQPQAIALAIDHHHKTGHDCSGSGAEAYCEVCNFEWSPATRISWLIVGGESGSGARPFDIAWARAAIEQCREAAVPCFVKQLGARPVDSSDSIGERLVKLRHRKGGDPAEWPEDMRVREWP